MSKKSIVKGSTHKIRSLKYILRNGNIVKYRRSWKSLCKKMNKKSKKQAVCYKSNTHVCIDDYDWAESTKF